MQWKKVFSLIMSTLLLAVLMAAPYGSVAQNVTFTTIDFPGATDTLPFDINNQGDIVGEYSTTGPISGNGALHGFLLRAAINETLSPL